MPSKPKDPEMPPEFRLAKELKKPDRPKIENHRSKPDLKELRQALKEWQKPYRK